MARKSRKAAAPGEKAQGAAQEMKVYRTAAYARLSVEDSKNPDCDTIENQLSLVRDYIASRPYLTQTAEYIDNGVSGTRFDRPEFTRMVNDMRAGEIDCIVVKDLSRLGRNYLETGDYLEKIFPFFGIRFIAVTDGYDSTASSAADDGLIVPLKNLINEAYAKDMSKKISTAIDIKQRQGKFIGCRAPYGYRKSPEDKNQLIVDREVSGIVVRIFECKAAGMGNGAIARMLNEEGIASPMRYKYEKGLTKNKRYADGLWNDSTIAAIILNPVYIGDMEQGIQKEAMYMGIKKYKPQKSERIYVAGTHEPIVSRELYNEVQELVEERKQRVITDRKKYGSVGKRENKFSHIIFCGDCGGRLGFHRHVKKYPSGKIHVHYDYFCPNSASYGERFCKRKRIKMQDLEEAVEAALRVHIKLFLDTKEVLQKLNRTEQAGQIQDSCRRQMAETRSRMERAQSMNSSLYSDYADGLLNERDYLFAKKKYVKEAEEMAQKLSELAAVQATYEAEYAGGGMAETIGRYADFQELSSEIVHTLVKRIVFFGEGRVEIEYTFADEMKEFVELAESRKGEVLCTKEETV